VVVVTGVDGEDQGIAAREAGADYYIRRPVHADVISLLVQWYVPRSG
jgi:DNA-binding response OmpR family regulator